MESKRTTIPAILLGAILIGGGYMLFTNEDRDELKSDTSYIRTNDPKKTRAFLTTGEADKDCKDFRTQQEAQLFFESNGGPESDPHNMDRDRDGRVCESLK